MGAGWWFGGCGLWASGHSGSPPLTQPLPRGEKGNTLWGKGQCVSRERVSLPRLGRSQGCGDAQRVRLITGNAIENTTFANFWISVSGAFET